MEATKEQIAEWKNRYGEVYEIPIKGTDKSCYIKQPDRKSVSYSMSVGRTDPMKSNEVLFNACWIDGDPEIKTNTAMFIAASNKLSEIVYEYEADLVKL